MDHMKNKAEDNSFVDLRENGYKPPLGKWTTDPIFEEAGKFNEQYLCEESENYPT